MEFLIRIWYAHTIAHFAIPLAPLYVCYNLKVSYFLIGTVNSIIESFNFRRSNTHITQIQTNNITNGSPVYFSAGCLAVVEQCTWNNKKNDAKFGRQINVSSIHLNSNIIFKFRVFLPFCSRTRKTRSMQALNNRCFFFARLAIESIRNVKVTFCLLFILSELHVCGQLRRKSLCVTQVYWHAIDANGEF